MDDEVGSPFPWQSVPVDVAPGDVRVVRLHVQVKPDGRTVELRILAGDSGDPARVSAVVGLRYHGHELPEVLAGVAGPPAGPPVGAAGGYNVVAVDGAAVVRFTVDGPTELRAWLYPQRGTDAVPVLLPLDVRLADGARWVAHAPGRPLAFRTTPLGLGAMPSPAVGPVAAPGGS